MADLPDWYTLVSEVEAVAYSFRSGADAAKPASPEAGDVYFATDTLILYICAADGVWTGFDASILVQGTLTLYANLLGGGYRLTNIADPTAAQDAATRAYVLAQLASYLALAGGTMAGNIAMGGNKVTGLGAPSAQNDALRYNQAEIRNAEIAAAAAIVYSKLNLSSSIVNADIADAAAIAESKLNLDHATQTIYDKIATDIATHAALRTGIHGVTIVRKAADETVNNSATLQNDDDLVIAVGADDVWFAIVHLYALSATTTPDLDYAFSVPSGGTIRTGYSWANSGTPVSWGAGTTERTMALSTTAKYFMFYILYIGGGTAGNLQLQWAQKTATEEDTTMKADSFIIAQRLA